MDCATEFADTMPSEFSGAGGVVRHPLGLRYGRGLGSSVGSAAAVAAGLCAFAIGTETQNSIQAPAVHTSIVGFKPTVRRVSRHGVVPLVPSQDAPGPLTLTLTVEAGEVDVLLAPMASAAKCTSKAGAPVAAIPVGRDADGLPFGVTVYAAPEADETVLRAAALIEARIGQRVAAVLD